MTSRFWMRHHCLVRRERTNAKMDLSSSRLLVLIQYTMHLYNQVSHVLLHRKEPRHGFM
jgi:hypothetical protein